ncbi:MAG: transglycosylase domain-containing protein, partial [Rikenellaceae bacterium]
MLMLAGLGAFGPLPTFEELESPVSNVASDLVGDDGTIIGQYYVHNRSFIEYNELSPNLVNALVSTEDARFTSHSGIDFIGLFRVAFKSVLLGGNQGGGSTISQQLAKNLFPRDIDREDGKIMRKLKTITFKMKEWITAIRLEYNYTKEEILVMYLNVVEYGSNAYGIKSAAQTFFGKLPSEVTVEEAAMLVGVVNAPTLYSPVGNPDLALERRNTVIRRMYSNDKLTRQERDSISAIPINLNFRPVSYNEGIATYFRSMIQQYMNAGKPKRSSFLTKWDYDQEVQLWETDPLYGWCSKNLKPDGTRYNIYRDGLRIYTTLNAKMQKYAEEAVEEHMKNTIQPSFDAEIRRRNGNMFSGISTDEQERIIWNSIKTSDRYENLPDELKGRAQAVAEFKKPVKMKIFSYKHHFGKDTVMT